MRIKFRRKYYITIIAALVLFILDFYFLWGKRWFYPGLVVCITIAWLHFWIDFFKETNRQKEIELKFLEFVRNLVEAVRSGVSVNKGIIEVSNEDYGALNPYIKKLVSQIEWGIPLSKCLLTFSKDTNNNIIKRAVAIVLEAEASGGDIARTLDSVTESVLNIKKMKEERRVAIYSQIVQGYIVFFVFIAIMIILQLWLFPKLTEMSGTLLQGGLGLGFISTGTGSKINLDQTFFALILIQGFFAGIMIGKFSEGSLKQGLIHSLILMTLGALIITTARGGI